MLHDITCSIFLCILQNCKISVPARNFCLIVLSEHHNFVFMKKTIEKAGKKTDVIPDKQAILDRALKEKQLSRDDYDMWRHVYDMQKVYKDMPEESPVRRRNRRRNIY